MQDINLITSGHDLPLELLGLQDILCVLCTYPIYHRYDLIQVNDWISSFSNHGMTSLATDMDICSIYTSKIFTSGTSQLFLSFDWSFFFSNYQIEMLLYCLNYASLSLHKKIGGRSTPAASADQSLQIVQVMDDDES